MQQLSQSTFPFCEPFVFQLYPFPHTHLCLSFVSSASSKHHKSDWPLPNSLLRTTSTQVGTASEVTTHGRSNTTMLDFHINENQSAPSSQPANSLVVTLRNSLFTKSLLPPEQSLSSSKPRRQRTGQYHRQSHCSCLHHTQPSDGQIACQNFGHISSTTPG